MTRANQEALLLSIASLLMMATVFAMPLGIPAPWDIAPMMSAFIFFFFIYRLRKKTKTEMSGKPVPVASLDRRKKIFRVLSASLIFGSVAVLPFLPYTVENFQPWIYYYVVPAQILFLVVFLSWYRKKMLRPDIAEPVVKS